MSALEPRTRRRSPCRVLIADDHDDSRLTQRLVLEHFGFAVTEAQNGLDALAIALASHPHIILIDVIMPEVDGCQLARMLRADPATRNTSLVAVSAMADPETRERALLAGCDEFVTKPVPPAPQPSPTPPEIGRASCRERVSRCV